MKLLQVAERRRAGFTLVELLIVIAIIALLAALTMGVVLGLINSARASHCLGLQNSIGKAFQAYAMDQDDRLPPADTWHKSLGQHLGVRIRTGNTEATEEDLSNSKVMLCPIAYRRDSKRADEKKLITYARNALLSPRTVNPVKEEDTPRISDFQVASKAVLVMDAKFSGTSWVRKITLPTDYNAGGTTPGPAAYHGSDEDSANALWVDGHVSSMKYAEIPRTASGGSPWILPSTSERMPFTPDQFWRGYTPY